MLAILEYKAGNQTSVRRALEHLGIPCRITADPAELEQAQGIIFPGVGAAGQAMEALTSAGLDSVLRRAVAEGQPLLGICLGCQILLEHSEENDMRTLGIVPGRCVRFPDHMKEEDGSPAPVPHMGWNSLEVVRPGRLLRGIEPGAEFYFVHSYCMADVSPEWTTATCTYGQTFTAAIQRGNVMATQFHPEKSGEVGLNMLRRFAQWKGEKSC